MDRSDNEDDLLDISLLADGSKIKDLRKRRRWTQEKLAKVAKVSKGTVEKAEAGRRIKSSGLKNIAGALGTTFDTLVASTELRACMSGTPEKYLQAIIGMWEAKCLEHAGKDYRGRKVPPAKSVWRVTLARVGDLIAGSCKCQTSGLEHEQFSLSGSVNGRGFVMIDGTRGVEDGADHIFRGLLQFHSDGRTRSMEGGYVVYDVTNRSIFVGDLRLDRKTGPGTAVRRVRKT